MNGHSTGWNYPTSTSGRPTNDWSCRWNGEQTTIHGRTNRNGRQTNGMSRCSRTVSRLKTDRSWTSAQPFRWIGMTHGCSSGRRPMSGCCCRCCERLRMIAWNGSMWIDRYSCEKRSNDRRWTGWSVWNSCGLHQSASCVRKSGTHRDRRTAAIQWQTTACYDRCSRWCDHHGSTDPRSA